LSSFNQVSAEDWPDTRGGAGALKFDGSVDPVSVGAGERAKAPPGRRFGERLGTGDTQSKREVGVRV
jgi:hypothetical protein